MNRAMIVIPVEWPDDDRELHHVLQVAMRGFKEHFTETGEQLSGPVWVTVDPEDMALLRELQQDVVPGGGPHVLVVENERWHLRHSLVCRRAGLENCPITGLVSVGMDQPLWGVGEHELRLDETGVLLWGDDL